MRHHVVELDPGLLDTLPVVDFVHNNTTIAAVTVAINEEDA